MVVTVTGGSGSGKSRMAEEISQALCGGRKLYIATMIVCDEESRKRMERHQRQRAGMYFETVERPFGLERLTFKEKERLILLECMPTSCMVVRILPCGIRKRRKRRSSGASDT